MMALTPSKQNPKFDFGGINHLALVCSDMRQTVDFYSGVLGMPLIKTVNIPGGGQHFFFDCGGGDSLAFFWFENAPDGVPGISHPKTRPDEADFVTAVASMNHVSFTVPVEKFDEYVENLKAAGIAVSPVWNHDDSPTTVAETLHDGVYVRSVYFQDPDGVLLEFACWTREFGPGEAELEPKTGAERRPQQLGV
ncbi:MAG TPA: VOC family protein [Pseudonocardia sp.]|jgi:catechol 2,3-dioxygenase-like lactoylglutathione lyase family enzyme|nr:VOC family protein [Pseudonocardia sp.]